MKGKIIRRIYTDGDLRKMKLKGKPKCPYCEKPVIFIYDDLPHGHMSQLCPNCGRKVMVDVGAMTVHKIVNPPGA